jgi:hypothetical protein
VLVSHDESLVSVVAHGLLNDLAVIQGLVAHARDQLEPNTPRNDRSDYLLQLAELKAITVVEGLRRYAWGISGEPSPTAPVFDLVERRR